MSNILYILALVNTARLTLSALEVSYTPVPASSKLTPAHEVWDIHFNAWKVARLGFPESAAQVRRETDPPIASPITGVRLPPDEHLLCFDFLYYMGVVQPFEWMQDYSPQWAVGTHVHWEPKLHAIAESYLRRLFGIKEDDANPPVCENCDVHTSLSLTKDISLLSSTLVVVTSKGGVIGISQLKIVWHL